MRKKFNWVWERLADSWLPLALVVVYLLSIFLLKDIFPASGEIISGFSRLFDKYGYELIFFGAFLEAALIIDLFVPGVSVIILGAYFASIGVISYPIFLVISIAGFTLGYFLDYLIGFYGWSDILRRFGFSKELDMAKSRVQQLGGKSFFLGYIHPDTASVFALAAGTVRMPIKYFLFYNFLAGSLWLIFWTGLVFVIGQRVEDILNNHFLHVVLAIVLVGLLYRIFKK